MTKFKELFENGHGYDKNSKEELELLLKHHQEDLEEYKEKGLEIEEIQMDIKEIKQALKGK